MADYARDELQLDYATTSALDPKQVDRLWTAVPASPTAHSLIKVSASTSGTTVDLGGFSTIEALYVRNTDSTNFVLARAKVIKATKTFSADKIGFVTGPPDTITDDDSTFLSALYAKAGDSVLISGATESGNNATWFIQKAVAGTLTLDEDAAVTADADDAGTPLFTMLSDNQEKVIAGQFVKFNSIQPAGDLVLTADTAACICEVFVVGT